MSVTSLLALAHSFVEELQSGEKKAAEQTGAELVSAINIWSAERRSDRRTALGDQIRDLLADGVGRTAADIAKELYLTRKEVNAVLYATSEFEKSDDSKPFWSWRE